MEKKTIIIILSVVAVLTLALILAFILLSNNPISNKMSSISMITYSDENSSIVITKNNADKTAEMNMIIYMDKSELFNKEFNLDMTESVTNMMCRIMSLAFFNETALEEFNKEIEDWRVNGSVKDDSGKEIGKPEANPLEGYKMTQFQFYLKDKSTRSILGECLVTGYGAEFVKMKVGGKDIVFSGEQGIPIN